MRITLPVATVFLAILSTDSAIAHAPAESPGVTVYTDKDYKDNKTTFRPHNFDIFGSNLAILNADGAIPLGSPPNCFELIDCPGQPFNDTISSVRLRGSLTVASLYEHKEFVGRCLTVTKDIPNLVDEGFNDVASSVKAGVGCPATRLTLFADSGFAGKAVDVHVDQIANLKEWHFNDTVSSIEIDGNAPTAVYWDSDFRGACLTVRGKIGDLGDKDGNDWNDEISSLKFNATCPSQLVMYKDKNFSGDSRALDSGVSNLKDIGFNDAVTSLKVATVAALYRDKNWGGGCRTVRGRVSLLDGGWNDEVTGVRIGRDCSGQTFVNLAAGRPATQSSTFGAAEAGRAVDGNTDGAYGRGSVSHTNNAEGNWWQVDLGSALPIRGVAIWNRTDSNCAGSSDCRKRLNDFVLMTSVDGEIWTNTPHAGGAFTVIDIPLSANARYVKIQLDSQNPLHLAEVQVWRANP